MRAYGPRSTGAKWLCPARQRLINEFIGENLVKARTPHEGRLFLQLEALVLRNKHQRRLAPASVKFALAAGYRFEERVGHLLICSHPALRTRFRCQRRSIPRLTTLEVTHTENSRSIVTGTHPRASCSCRTRANKKIDKSRPLPPRRGRSHIHGHRNAGSSRVSFPLEIRASPPDELDNSPFKSRPSVDHHHRRRTRALVRQDDERALSRGWSCCEKPVAHEYALRTTIRTDRGT